MVAVLYVFEVLVVVTLMAVWVLLVCVVFVAFETFVPVIITGMVMVDVLFDVTFLEVTEVTLKEAFS